MQNTLQTSAKREFSLSLPSAAKYLQIYTKKPKTPHSPQHYFHALGMHHLVAHPTNHN